WLRSSPHKVRPTPPARKAPAEVRIVHATDRTISRPRPPACFPASTLHHPARRSGSWALP
ncbi:MAG: hypothetical protein AVDCRST_MAG89-3901, partial [uncultured Gemmatimonadetes bacterium]